METISQIPYLLFEWIKSWSWKSWIKLAVMASFFASLGFGFVFYKQEFLYWIEFSLNWAKGSGFKGILVLQLLFICTSVFYLPFMLILTFSCGVIWGYYGMIIACVETSVGASCAFLVGSSVESTIQEYPKLKFIDKAIEEEGWKMVLILRIVPVIPFATLNFLLTITNVDVVTFFFCTLFGMIPRMALYVYIGISAGSIPDIIAGNVKFSLGNSENRIYIYLLGFATFIIGFYVIYFTAKKYIDKYNKEE